MKNILTRSFSFLSVLNNPGVNVSIVEFIKKPGDFYTGDYIAPLTRFVKYPLSLDAVLKRVADLGKEYSIPLNVKTYRMNAEGIKLAKQEMKDKGGIYIWYCHVTGYFYLGSAQVFFGKDARLSTYLMKSRLSGKYRHVSRDLAKDLLAYGYESFTVIIVENFDRGMLVEMLLYQEQLWMMLYPTYNRSLNVGSNDGQPMAEDERRALSTTVYQYEVLDGSILAGSEVVHYGVKELTRTGFKGADGASISMTYFELNVLLKTGGLFQGRFLFTKDRLVGASLTDWTAPVVVSGDLTKGADKRSFGIFVYKTVDSAGPFTSANFVEFISSVSDCRDKYNISKTHFQRVRRYNSPVNGFVFSNHKLHE